uniref:Uncharacterized protein B8J22.205 n=1 Tax=Neurospora crassa TaxID=5141 RepID=Q6MVK2_NEUCS|nr:putative protein [Neurospora crassa]
MNNALPSRSLSPSSRFILSRFLFTSFSAPSPDLHQHPASESAPASSLWVCTSIKPLNFIPRSAPTQS